MKRISLALLALFAFSAAFGQTTISALPAGSTLAGTEAIPMDQTGGCSGNTCKTTPAAIATYVAASATPITSLPNASALSGSEAMLGVQSSTAVQISPAQISTYANGHLPAATASTAGVVEVSSTATTIVPVINPALSVSNGCAAFTNINGDLSDAGDPQGIRGRCAVYGTDSHISPATSGTATSFSAGSCTGGCNDQRGHVTGLSGVTTVTVTFGNTWNNTPVCVVTLGTTFTTPMFVNPAPTTAHFVVNWTASFTGGFYYICM